jgi:branched-chain amino acid transport system substrate-binding protein
MSQHKRMWCTVALATAVVMVVGACGSSSSKTVASPAAGGPCKDLSIAFFGALTGSSANLGINENDGENLAVSQFNKANPTCQIKVTPFDSTGSPTDAPALAQKAVDDKNVVAVVGPAFSGESKAADPTFNDAGMPTITASATNVALSTNGWTTFHRAVANDGAQGPAVANYIRDGLAAKKVAVIDDASDYGKGIATIVKAKLGALVTVTDEIDPKATDYSSTVTKVKGGNVDAVFYGGYYQAAGLLAKQLHDAGVTAKFVAPDGSEDPGFIVAAGAAAAEGAILTAPSAPATIVSGGTQFIADYQDKFKVDPALYSVEAYDATNIILAAIKAGNTTRKTINDYLNTNVDYQGLAKHYKFDSKGELSGTLQVYAYTVKAGKIVGLKPINA